MVVATITSPYTVLVALLLFGWLEVYVARSVLMLQI